MNKTDKLAKERFGGDLHRAILFIASLPKEEMESYAMEMHNKQLLIFMEILNHKALSEMSEEQRVSELGRDYTRNKVRKMLFSREEFRNAKANPYLSPLILHLGLLAVSVIIPVIVVFFFSDLPGQMASYITIGCGVVMTFLAMTAAESVSNFRKFRLYQKLYAQMDL